MRDIDTIDSELTLVAALRRAARERGGSLPSIAVAVETPPLSRGHSAGVFEFCSGLVDLVVCVGRHGGGGHRLTLAGERFVGRLGHRGGGAIAVSVSRKAAAIRGLYPKQTRAVLPTSAGVCRRHSDRRV